MRLGSLEMPSRPFELLVAISVSVYDGNASVHDVPVRRIR